MVSMRGGLAVGELLRILRERRGLSLRQLATQSGFSPSFISQVEKGQASPSINSLEKIAAVLDVTLAEFFTDAEGSGPHIIAAGRRQNLTSSWSRARIEALGPTGPGHRLRPLLITFAPGGQSGKEPAAALQEEFALIFEGQITLVLGDFEYQLGRGDAVTIPPAVPHRWLNTSQDPAQVVLVTAQPQEILRG